MNHPIFVYGTLRRNQGNSKLLIESKFIGTFSTLKKYRMSHGYSIPFVSKADKVPQDLHGLISMRTRFRPVIGEVYEVDDITLETLDDFEGHPHWYKREVIDIAGFGKAWCYLMDPKMTKQYRSAKQTDDRCYDWLYAKLHKG